MAKAGRGQTRRDSKRRVLRPGESVRADGKYQYKYHIDGKPHFVYSWKLEPTDKLPKGKKPCLSLRELEKQVNTDLDLLVNIVDGQMTVCELVDRYLKTKTGVRQSTKQGYVTEITCKGSIWQKDDTKCENFRCKVVSYQIAAGRWQKLQFHSYHPWSVATSLSDGGG